MRGAVIALLLGGSSLLRAADAPRFTPEMEDFVRSFKPGGQDFAGQAQILSPEESVRRMKVADGYVAQLVATEPAVRQPIDLKFDERGRLWVVQYLQYPFPAGITVTAYDQYLRAEFDRLSPPPPRHYRGADKITILEDRDGDGRFETDKTFVDGLNMATSVLPGTGGVWVLMSPYLLFYPDRNSDDVPDGDPEVHLAGFGLEDTHSLASNLHWGPDGWIYGATGSTTNLEIQGVRLLGQGIWRYHPDTKVFEVFAEGGGNTFSFEFDRLGRAYSGTNNGATRGLHYVQGATYVKGWTKHGPPMNPFIFGFFEHMEHQGYSQRFPQTFLFYEADLMPQLNGEIVVGMAMTNRVQASTVLPDTSTFRTTDSTALITTDDRTFRPVDIEQGPDGAIYVADWSDLRLSHLNPKDTWDKAHGRIVRIAPRDYQPARPIDLRALATNDLIARLEHPNREHREHARRLLASRPDRVEPALRAMLEKGDESALEALWGLNLRGELSETQLRSALRNRNEHVRRWAVRLLGDGNRVTGATAAELVAMARREPAVEVRSQLASSARRLPAGQALPIVRELLLRDEDAADKHQPLLIWWALEAKADTGREELVALVRDPAVWRSKIFRGHTAERIGMRYTADQGPRKHYQLKQGVYSEWLIDRAPEFLARNLEMGARLLHASPGQAERDLLLQGMARGLTGPAVEGVPAGFKSAIAQAWNAGRRSAGMITLAARVGLPEAVDAAIAVLTNGKPNESDQQQLLDLLAALAVPKTLPFVANLVRNERNEARRAKRLAALGGFDVPAAAEIVLEVFPSLTPRLQNTAQRMLAERPTWAVVMLQRANDGTFNPGVLSSASLALLQGHRNPRIDSLLLSYQQRHSSDPRQQQAQQLFETGKVAYNLSCSPCHQETGEGRIGLAPPLTGSRWLGASDEVLLRIVLQGKENPGRGMVMPPWRHLEDRQLAAILTYVRREFGNQPAMVEPGTVKQVRDATADRQKPWIDAELNALPPKTTAR